jgi:dihydropteroate synthase
MRSRAAGPLRLLHPRAAGRAAWIVTSSLGGGLVDGDDVDSAFNRATTPGALDIASKSDAAVCLMHMRGEPQTMQFAPAYADVVTEIRAFLQRRAAACMDAGIAASRIVVDPGFGFGKSVAHNLELLRDLDAITALGYPVMAGLSRKSTLGAITGRDVDDRLASSLAAALAAARRGARILRVHDVRETVDALAVWNAIEPWPGSYPSRATEQ